VLCAVKRTPTENSDALRLASFFALTVDRSVINSRRTLLLIAKVVVVSLGWVSALDLEGRTIWIVDAHDDGKRFIVRADEMLTAFVELERMIHEFAVSLVS